MTFKRYCPSCDDDRFPAANGACSECLRPIPTARASYTAPPTPSESVCRLDSTPMLTARQIKVLTTISAHGRALGNWNDSDLTKLETAKLVTREHLYASTGKASSQRLWTITVDGRWFLKNQRAGR